jgi:hypothetical protein
MVGMFYLNVNEKTKSRLHAEHENRPPRCVVKSSEAFDFNLKALWLANLAARCLLASGASSTNTE